MKSEELFSTYDIGLATALVSAGHRLYEMDRTNPKKVKFLFIQNKSLEKTIDSYWVSELNVDAKSFFENLKSLKNRIYSY